MAQIAYIDGQLLKDRLVLHQLAAPLESDLDRIVLVASEMVKDRAIAFNEADPPDAVQQVTLMLAMNLRIAETGGYTDADGRPVQVPLWTPAMTDILGRWARDTTPGPASSPAAGTIRTARAGITHSEYRRPCGVGYPEYWDD